uniref:Uncharacterized protein n=1 Tax=Meloidogyne javanica TaxID=6303 RepID=A0A915LUE7_MELJA
MEEDKDFIENNEDEEPIYEEIEYYLEDLDEKEDENNFKEIKATTTINSKYLNNNWLAAEGIIESTTKEDVSKFFDDKKEENER